MPADRLFHRRAGHSVKVNGLTDFEFRVWWAYIMAADDFGILRHSHVELQSICDALAAKKPAVVMRALNHVVSVGLIKGFEHQGQPYLFQPDWQEWQKVKWPSRTINPAPPLDALTQETQLLFRVFPGGSQVPKKFRGSTSEVPKENLDGTFPRQQTANANGTGLMANGLEEGSGETPPLDTMFWQLHRTYPANRRSSGPLTEQAFIQQFQSDTRKPPVVFAEMLVNLESQIAGHEWRVKGMVPKLEKWLRDGLWRQRHEVAPVASVVSEKTARTLTAAAEFIKGGQRGA